MRDIQYTNHPRAARAMPARHRTNHPPPLPAPYDDPPRLSLASIAWDAPGPTPLSTACPVTLRDAGLPPVGVEEEVVFELGKTAVFALVRRAGKGRSEADESVPSAVERAFFGGWRPSDAAVSERGGRARRRERQARARRVWAVGITAGVATLCGALLGAAVLHATEARGVFVGQGAATTIGIAAGPAASMPSPLVGE
jgi:hypothetical protein